MIKMTMISLVILTILALAVGAVIGYFWKKRTEGTWKADFQVADKENKRLAKAVKKNDKDLNRLKKQNESVKEKMATQEAESKTAITELEKALTIEKEKWANAKVKQKNLLIEHQQVTHKLEVLQKTHQKLTEKYQQDTTNLKEWSKDKTLFNRQFKELKNKVKLAEEKVSRLTTSNEKLTKEIADNQAFVAKLRALKAKNAKYAEDLKYWEKKHYDTHHELANLKTKVDGIVARNEELEMTNQSASQSNQQMLQKVQEFKTKFVDINNKYHKLVDSRKN